MDAYHMNQEEADFHQALRNCGDKLYDFHVADNNRMACGQGQLDWAAIVGTLKEIGYDGALTVEFVAPIDRTPANPYKNATASAEAELTAEQLKFIEDHGSGVLSEEFYSWLVEETAKTLLPLIK
jgi:sugar phosphate isomerase/epimerase